MIKENFFYKHNKVFQELIKLDTNSISKLLIFRKCLLEVQKKKKKVFVFGNGGSAAIANHFLIDLIKNTKIRAINLNETSIVTCLANDYGYENWVKKGIELSADKGDLVIIISSSGESKNMINACNFAKKKKLKIVTFTGFKKGNKVSKLGNINFWINSKKYNHIENSHQYLLLSIIDSFLE